MHDLKRTSWNFFSGTHLTFGPNAITTLTGIIQRDATKRVFLITDNVLEEVGAVRQVQKAINQSSAELHVFTDCEGEPSIDTVQQSVAVAGDFHPDLFVALGGGSKMDLAKACCAVVGNDCSAESLLGFNNVPGPMAKLVCVPTTAGTGSEVSHSAVLNNSASGKKSVVLSQLIRPQIAIVDPYMTLSCPARVTADSGMGALVHAVEACLATNFFQFKESVYGDLPFEGNNPFGDMYAEKAIRLIADHLQKAVEEPENLAARSGMSMAATLAGVAYSNSGGGLCHAFEQPIRLASECCSYAACKAIVLPEVVRFLAQHRPAKVAKIASCLNDDFVGLPHDEAADAAIDFLCQLHRDIGLPTSLSEIGIEESQLPQLAASAFSQQRLVDLTPGFPNEADGLKILTACL